jgi:hypothetical protein
MQSHAYSFLPQKRHGTSRNDNPKRYLEEAFRAKTAKWAKGFKLAVSQDRRRAYLWIASTH